MLGGGGGMAVEQPQQSSPVRPGPGQSGGQAGGDGESREAIRGTDRERRFVAVVLGSTEEVWSKMFAASGGRISPGWSSTAA